LTTIDTPRGPGRAWRAGGLAAAVVTVLLGCAAVLAVLTQPGNAVTDANTSYPLGSAAVVVTAPSDGVDLMLAPGNAGRLTVESHVVFTAGSPPSAAAAWDGHTLRLDLRCARRLRDTPCRARYTVRVPSGTAVAASTAAGDIAASGLTGDLRLASGAGDISVTGVRGPLSVRATNGDIAARALRSPTAELTTSTGDIFASFADPPTWLDATTHNGDIALALPTTTSYRVAAETNTGVRHVDVPQAPGATHLVTAHTDLGDLAIH
jgi:hypothetical protein